MDKKKLYIRDSETPFGNPMDLCALEKAGRWKIQRLNSTQKHQAMNPNNNNNEAKMIICFYFEDKSQGMDIRYGYNFKTDPGRARRDMEELVKGIRFNNQISHRKKILHIKVYNRGTKKFKKKKKINPVYFKKRKIIKKLLIIHHVIDYHVRD